MPAGGFKTFVAGEILTSADTNDFLMQGVLVFEDATARDAAITSPVEGQFVFRTDEDVLEFFDGTDFVPLETGLGSAVISGTTGSPTVASGVVIGDETFDVFTFTGDGSITVAESGLIDVVCVGGGGSGGSSTSGNAGGGGGGALLQIQNVINAGTFTVTVGAGGADRSGNSQGISGGASSVGTFFEALGGGGGASSNSIGLGAQTGQNAGCGGGTGSFFNLFFSAATGTSSGEILFGTRGGASTSGTGDNIGAGGGGGAGEDGGNGSTSAGGKGGDGKTTAITGTVQTFAGGGGGQRRSGSGGADGVAGGGAANGGGGTTGRTNSSVAAGSGIVIVRVAV